MGSIFSQLAVWNYVHNKQYLAFVKQNEIILRGCLRFVDILNGVHAWESMVVFEEPLTWFSNLTPDNFPAEEYIKTKGKIISVRKGGRLNAPIMEFTSKAMRRESDSSDTFEIYKIKVWNFNFLKKIMDLAGTNKLVEARRCFEGLADFDLYKRIIGEHFDNNSMNDMIAFMESSIDEERKKADEQFLKAVRYRKATETQAGKNIYTMRLFTLIRQFEMQFLKQSIKTLVNEVQLTAEKIQKEVSTIQMFCGNDPNRHLLKTIRYISEMVSARGARPPIWREFCGDICYLYIEPFDRKEFFAACNTGGYYMMKGYNYSTLQMNFQRVGLVHRDLISFLSSLSPKFNENFCKEEVESLLLGSLPETTETPEMAMMHADQLAKAKPKTFPPPFIPTIKLTFTGKPIVHKKGIVESRWPPYTPTLKWAFLSTKKTIPGLGLVTIKGKTYDRAEISQQARKWRVLSTIVMSVLKRHTAVT